MKDLDEEITAALTGLESSVPGDYFEEFPSRLEERLEVVQAMGPDMSQTGDDADDKQGLNVLPPERAGVEVHAENSDLADIKMMAQSTKQRISKRKSTESDVEAQLLSASSSALAAVVLPQPGRGKPRYETEDGIAADATASAGAETSPGGSKPIWLYALVAAGIAAGIVFYATRGGGGSSDTVARNDRVAADERATVGVPGEPAKTSAPASVPDPAVADDGDKPDDTAPLADPAGPEATDPTTIAPPADKAVEPAPAAVAVDKRADKKKRSRARRDPVKRAVKKPKAKAPATEPAKPKNAKSGSHSLDDLLDEASEGGSGSMKDVAKKADEPKKKQPTITKKDLTRGEIQHGMRSILGRVGACYNRFKVSGTVKVAIVIAPSGRVSKASATGKFANSETGLCVAAAAQYAKFPAWEGKPKRFNYPFLLSP